MLTFHGHSLAPGVAIAAAARMEETFGVPQMALERQRHMGETLLRAGLDLPDPDEIVVVARRLPPGFLVSTLPGLRVVGAVLGDADALPENPACPVVSDIGDDLLAETQEGDIVIVDGDRGRVYIAPDAQTLARYQGPLRRARRFFLEPVHVAARRGGDGPAVPVLTAATDWEDLRAAVDAGVDGIVIPQGGGIWEDDNFLSASEQRLRLAEIGKISGGKLLFLQVPLERVALSALAQAAAWGPVHLVLDAPDMAPEARAELDALEAELADQDLVFGRVALDAVLGAGDRPARKALLFLDGVFAEAADEMRAQVAAVPGLPLTAFVETPEQVSALLNAGAARLLCPTPQTQAVKEAVRRA